MASDTPMGKECHPKDWTWPREPTSDAEADAMLESLDRHLADRGLLPHQRPFMALLLVSNHLWQWTGYRPTPFFPQPSDPPLMGLAQAWWAQAYGGRHDPHFDARSFALNVRGTIWRATLPVVFGQVVVVADRRWDLTPPPGVTAGGTLNAVRAIRDFTPFLAARLTDGELAAIAGAFERAWPVIDALGSAPDHPLLRMAQLDYAHSVDALVSGVAWSKARWDTAQAAEKAMKGRLARAGFPFPKGKDGHHLKQVARAFTEAFGVELPEAEIAAIDCRSGVRYGEESTTRDQAMAAHESLLALLPLVLD